MTTDQQAAGPNLVFVAAVLTRGKIVFGEYCARCHSSKLPESAPGVDPGGQSGKDYLTAFKRYWMWTKTAEFKQKMRQIVLADDFLDGNYLSTELRIPTTLLKTNACSALATNALRGDIWDNFSSQTYKDLPSVGKIKVHNPITGAAFRAGYRLTGRSVATEALWLVLVVALCLGGAYLFHRLVERPSLTLSHRVRLDGARS